MIKKMCRLVIKISIALSVILLIIFLVYKPLLYLILGLLIGAYYSVTKTYIFENLLLKAKFNNKFYVKTISSQILNFLILIIAILVNTNFFIGITIGILLLPFVITISAFKKSR